MEEILLNQLGIEIVEHVDCYLGFPQYNKLFIFKSYYDGTIFSRILKDINILSDFGTKKNVFNNFSINNKIYNNAIIMTESNIEQLKPNFIKNVYIKFFLMTKNSLNLFANIIETDNIYKYNFFSTERTLQINKLALQKIYDTYVWIIPQENMNQIDELWKSLIFRYPVYFGSPKYNMFNMARAKKYFPYLNNEELINNVPRNNIYTIGSLIDCYAYRTNKIGTIGMLHTWGINFESNTTPDYKEMISKDQWKKDGFKIYVNRTRQLLKTIFAAVDNLVIKANMLDRQIILRIPALGLGNFLNGIINENLANECKLIFMSELLFAARSWKKKSDNKIIKFCQYDTKYNYLLMGEQADIEYQPDLLRVELSDMSDNVLTIIVNAWDSHSFIGNGGSRDDSIDGKIVAGIRGDIECAAYSQNPFFIPYDVLNKSMSSIN